MTIQPRLPEELWIQIFEYLSAPDIINLTTVCTNFADIIRKSALLTSKLTLKFDKRKKYGGMGRRRYGKLDIFHVDTSNHNNILKFIGNDITELSFCYENFKMDATRQILVLCENVKVLKFSRIDRVRGVRDLSATSKYPKHQGLELTVEQCDPRIFKVLKMVQADKVDVTCPEFARRQYFVDMVEFLRAQERLEELKLREFSGSIVGLGLVLFPNNALCDVQFRLKKLHLLNNHLIPYGHIDSIQFFSTFMNLHKSTLVDLSTDVLQEFDISSFVCTCRSLKSLAIGVELPFSSRIVVPSVERLETDCLRLDLVRCFPNVKELSIVNKWLVHDNSILDWDHLETCTLLEKIKIEDVPLDYFPSLPKVRSLKLWKYASIKSEAFARNPQIEELIIDKFSEKKTRKSKVLKIIMDYLENLKSLRIVSKSKLDQSATEYVMDKCKNLEYFYVYKDSDFYGIWGLDE